METKFADILLKLKIKSILKVILLALLSVGVAVGSACGIAEVQIPLHQSMLVDFVGSVEDSCVAKIENNVIEALKPAETTLLIKSKEDPNIVVEKRKLVVTPSQNVKCVAITPNNPMQGQSVVVEVLTQANVRELEANLITPAAQIQKLKFSSQAIDERTKKFSASVVLKQSGKHQVKVTTANKVEPTNGVECDFFVEPSTKQQNNSLMPKRASEAIIDFIAMREGFCAKVRKDTLSGKDIYDIGYGRRVPKNQPFYNNISTKEARAKLKELLNGDFTIRLNKFFESNKIELTQNQFDAILSFTYNLGTSWLYTKDSTLLKVILDCQKEGHLNFIDKKAFAEIFSKYHHAGGKCVKGLYERRIEELKIFFCQDYTGKQNLGFGFSAQFPCKK